MTLHGSKRSEQVVLDCNGKPVDPSRIVVISGESIQDASTYMPSITHMPKMERRLLECAVSEITAARVISFLR